MSTFSQKSGKTLKDLPPRNIIWYNFEYMDVRNLHNHTFTLSPFHIEDGLLCIKITKK